MNKRLIAAIVAVVLICGGVYFRFGPELASGDRASEQASSKQRSEPAADSRSLETAPASHALRLFKSTRYPPVTPEEKEMWDWWRQMEKADPKFEWKRPIEFYGQVLDQVGAPVAGAVVDYNWTTVIGPNSAPYGKTNAGVDGKFSIAGIYGKRLIIEVSKIGFSRTKDSRGSYEYAAFHEDLFHVPDKDRPVVFRLQKISEAEAMFKYQANTRISLGDKVYLNIESGKFGAVGDIEISVLPGKGRSLAGADYSIAIRAVSGGGFIPTDDEFMFSPPEEGYLREMTLERSAADTPLKASIEARLYMKTRSGKYAAVVLESLLWERRNESTLNTVIYFNPSGSRNLQFDQQKWINR